MSPQLIKILIPLVLLLHGLGHGGAIGALIAFDRGLSGGKWLSARSWLFPNLAPRAAKVIAIIFWGLSLVRFRGSRTVILGHTRPRRFMATACTDIRLRFVHRYFYILGQMADVQHPGCPGSQPGSHHHSAVAALAANGDVRKVRRSAQACLSSISSTATESEEIDVNPNQIRFSTYLYQADRYHAKAYW